MNNWVSRFVLQRSFHFFRVLLRQRYNGQSSPQAGHSAWLCAGSYRKPTVGTATHSCRGLGTQFTKSQKCLSDKSIRLTSSSSDYVTNSYNQYKSWSQESFTSQCFEFLICQARREQKELLVALSKAIRKSDIVSVRALVQQPGKIKFCEVEKPPEFDISKKIAYISCTSCA